MLLMQRTWGTDKQYYAMEGRRLTETKQNCQFHSYHRAKPFLKSALATRSFFEDDGKFWENGQPRSWKTIEHYVVASRFTNHEVQEYIRTKIKDLDALRKFVLAVEHTQKLQSSSQILDKDVTKAKAHPNPKPDNDAALLKALFFYLKKGGNLADFGNNVVVYVDSEKEDEKSLDLFFGQGAETNNKLGLALMNVYHHLEVNPPALDADAVPATLTLQNSYALHSTNDFECFRIGNPNTEPDKLAFLKASLCETIEVYQAKIKQQSLLSAIFSAQGRRGSLRAGELKSLIMNSNDFLTIFKHLRDHFNRREYLRPGAILGHFDGRLGDDSLDTKLLTTLEACAESEIDIPGADALCSQKLDRAKKRLHFVDGVVMLEEDLLNQQLLSSEQKITANQYK
ncbi:MAG: hypothetical protein AB7F64_01730 [Gammaproteobacteria bacterium]